jgi:hypothetical protein
MSATGEQKARVFQGPKTLLQTVWCEINRLTSHIEGKAFDPDWFLLGQQLRVCLSQRGENDKDECG